MKTITDLLAKGISSSPALIGIEPEIAITYGELCEMVARFAERLAASGLEPESRVAMVLPNGPEFIVTFIALLQAGLTAAPYNPAQGAELANLWRDAGIRAVIAATDDHASRDTAARVGLPVWALSINSKGRAELAVETSAGIGNPASPASDSIALFLHTSGTTSKPKGVPLTHGNLMASIENIASGYQLTPEDRTLLVMPLFHVHGLIGATLSTLFSGGTVIAPPRFSASQFWPLVKAHRASWYSAVPTIHRTLLMRADSDAPSSSGFRFIRSCSSALAPSNVAADGGALSGPGAGSVWDDRSGASDCVQSAAACAAQARLSRCWWTGRGRNSE